MKWWIVFVARRFLAARRGRGAGAAVLSITGIAAGVATLIVVLAVMNGFQLGTIENILEINSFHVRLSPGVSLSDRRRVDPLVHELRSMDGVSSAVATAEIQTLARGFWPEPQGIVIRAVPEDWLEQDRGAAERLSVPSGDFDVTSPGSMVIGAELARALGVRVGDTVAVMHIPEGSARPAEVALTVTGLFRSGYLDFDRTWAFVGLATAEDDLQADEELTVGVKLTNRFRDASAAGDVRDRFPSAGRVETWREYNRGIFGALRIEKAMMVFLVALIFIVVAGNIFQLLRRSILERSEEIAILRALGSSSREVRRVFALEGWLIGIVGACAGTLVGLLVAVNINEIFAALEWAAALVSRDGVALFSPAYFYLEEIPVRIPAHEVLLIVAGAIGVSAFSSWAAGRTVVRRVPLELLRSE